jgi:choline transport protein
VVYISQLMDQDAVNSRAGATVMGAVVLALTWSCAIGITTTASRMTWSFARDNGTPFSSMLSKVAKHNKVPIIAICTVAVLAALLHLIYIGSSVAFNDVVSLTITGFYSSYFLPAAMLLYRRIKGQVHPYVHPVDTEGFDPEIGVAHTRNEAPHLPSNDVVGDEDKKLTNPNENSPTLDARRHRKSLALETAPLVWGPFHLPGIFGIINNAYACVYMIFVIFWSVWPPATPVTASTMNYSVVVTGGVIIFSMVWYWIKGRKDYKGPIVDEEVRERAERRGSVVSIQETGE